MRNMNLRDIWLVICWSDELTLIVFVLALSAETLEGSFSYFFHIWRQWH